MSLQSKYFYKETIIKLSEMGLFTLHNCYVLYVHWTISVQTLSLPIILTVLFLALKETVYKHSIKIRPSLKIILKIASISGLKWWEQVLKLQLNSKI